MATVSSQDLIRRYLQDAIASERAFETQLRSMSKEGDDPRVQELFAMHADQTARQAERLTARLEQLGGSPSTMKSALAHLFGLAPKAGQIGQEDEDKNTQNLIIAYAVEQSEVATYEALKIAAETVGDSETARVAEEIQREEEATAQRVWTLLSSCAKSAVERQSETDYPESRDRGFREDSSGAILQDI